MTTNEHTGEAQKSAKAKAKTPVVLTEEQLRRQKAFFDVRIRHQMMSRLLDELVPLLTPDSESHIIVIVGPTGVGKSTLFRYLLATLFERFRTVVEADQTVVPLVTVEARSDGDGRPGFETLYEELLRGLEEPEQDRKVCMEVQGGKMRVRPHTKGRVKALRSAVHEALTRRRTRVCVIDEAAHLLKFAKESGVMETLKSLSNTTNVKWVLVGSYDLFDLIQENGQIARRSQLLSLRRYHPDVPEDVEAFTRVVKGLQDKWPCKQVPNFESVAKDLLHASLGCVGLLKTLMLEVSALQMHNGEKWHPRFLRDATLPPKRLAVIREDIEAGEAKVRDALRGNCIWDDETYAELVRRMEPSNA